jgi:hypothetical protein
LQIEQEFADIADIATRLEVDEEVDVAVGADVAAGDLTEHAHVVRAAGCRNS